MIRDGFFKVAEKGYSLTSAVFFNPKTLESYSCIVWDMDDDRIAWDREEERFAPIDADARRAWMHHNGIIVEGDVVEVFKGRKVPIGTVSTVIRIYDWRDKYGRVQATYAELENGMKTNIDNCRIAS